MRIQTTTSLRRATARAVAASALIAATAPCVHAQLPGLPTLQGAFPAPGLAVGANVGHDDGRTIFAGAVGYGPRSGKLSVVAGVGAATSPLAGYTGTSVTYGGRAALTVLRLMDQRIAITPFIGFGSIRSKLADPVAAGLGSSTTPGATTISTTTVRVDRIPIGVAAGWRHGLGATRTVALTVSPLYAISRRSGSTLDENDSRLRVAGVAEVALTSRLGVTIGGEAGQSSTGTKPGSRGATVGAGVSFLLRR